MSCVWKGVGLALIAGAGILMLARPGEASAADSAPPPGVAVVELFTSQGCSSCPPAEAVVGALNAATQPSHQPVFTLAFHVDYWDHLGWRDPFSDARFSARQYDYARTLHLDQVYTPQMIVNGKTEFVGSNQAKADHAIAAALAVPAGIPLTITSRADTAAGGAQVHFAAPAVTDGLVLNVAVVEQGLSTMVTRGENANQRLDQPSVVRWFTTVPASAEGVVPIPSLTGVQTARATVVAFVQRPGDGAILGAASAAMPSPSATNPPIH